MIKRRNQNQRRFSGVVGIGENRTSAAQAYRDAVLNRNFTLFSESNVFTAVAGDANGFSPRSGKKMSDASDYKDKLGMTSESSQLDAVAISTNICTDGCNKVLISDEDLDFCPSCSAALPELTDDETLNELANLESSSTDYGECDMIKGDQGIVVCASSLEEAQELFTQVLREPTQETAVGVTDGNATFITHASSDFEYSPFSGEAAEETELEIDLASISSIEDNAEANYFMCSNSCSKSHIISSGDTVFCPSCSGALVDPELVDELEAFASLDELEIEDDEEDFDSESSDPFDPESYEDEDEEEEDFGSESSDDDDLDDLDDDDDLDDLDLDDDDDFDSESGAEDTDELDELDELDEEEEFESDSSDDDDDDLEEDELDDLEDDLDDLDDEDSDDFDSESSVGELDINFFEAYAGVDEEQHDPNSVEFSALGSVNGERTVMAFYNGYPVARALESNASNQEIFNSPKFLDASIASVKSLGVKQGLEEMGYEFLAPDVDMNVSVSSKMLQQHKQEIEAIEASVSAQVSEVQDRFTAALKTVGMALNRNLFKGKSNPVQDVLISSLAAANVGRADELVSTCFAQKSDDFINLLVSMAAEQLAKPLEAQNEFAQLVAESNGQQIESTASVSIGRTVQEQQAQAAPQQTLASQSSLQSESSSEASSDFNSRLDSVFGRFG